MLSALAAWFTTKGVGLLLGALAKFALDFVNDRKKESALREAGAAEATSAINKETSDAQRRASEAAINASRGPDLDDELGRGDRQI